MIPIAKHSTSWILVADACYAQLWTSHRRGQVSALGTISPMRLPFRLPSPLTAHAAPSPAAPDVNASRDVIRDQKHSRLLPDEHLQEVSDPHQNKCDGFARELGQHLERCVQWGEFQHLVLVAPTNMLRALRENLSGAMRAMVDAEFDQDLTKSNKREIQARLRSLAIN